MVNLKETRKCEEERGKNLFLVLFALTFTHAMCVFNGFLCFRWIVHAIKPNLVGKKILIRIVCSATRLPIFITSSFHYINVMHDCTFCTLILLCERAMNVPPCRLIISSLKFVSFDCKMGKNYFVYNRKMRTIFNWISLLFRCRIYFTKSSTDFYLISICLMLSIKFSLSK